jgi:hypothetical protein
MSDTFLGLVDAFYRTAEPDFANRVLCTVTGNRRKTATLRQCSRVARGEKELPSARGQKKWQALQARGQFPPNALVERESFPHVWRMPTHVPMYTLVSPPLVAAIYCAVRLVGERWLDALAPRQRARVCADERARFFVDVFRRRMHALHDTVALDELAELASVSARMHSVESARGDADELCATKEQRRALRALQGALDSSAMAPENRTTKKYARACFWALFAAAAHDEAPIAKLDLRLRRMYAAPRRATDNLRSALRLARSQFGASPDDVLALARHFFGNFKPREQQ